GRRLVLAISVMLAVHRRGRHAGSRLGLGGLRLFALFFLLLHRARDGLDQLVLAHGTVPGDAERAGPVGEVLARGGLKSIEVHGTATPSQKRREPRDSFRASVPRERGLPNSFRKA